MSKSAAWLDYQVQAGTSVFRAGGEWNVRQLSNLVDQLEKFELGKCACPVIDLSDITELDTAGAWFLKDIVGRFHREGLETKMVGISALHKPLITLVQQASGSSAEKETPQKKTWLYNFEHIGRAAFEVAKQCKALINFFGITVIAFGRSLRNPRRIRLNSLVHQVEQTALDAVPIVCLLSFLIGVVLAFQGADQLRRFGAEIFTVNLLTLSVLREIGVLMTAIMLAGRSGSAFTAQIGTMQVNEEVDALRTLGLDPVEVLVMPRILALLISLPILTFLSDVMGILGGALMAVAVLDLTFGQFLRQLEEAITLTHFLVGMVKAPFFAYIIGIVGCYEGLRVSGSAESVGRMTTKSVVESIFLVIIADALFSILFSVLKI